MSNLHAPGLFDPATDVVEQGVGCTWCGAATGQACFERRRIWVNLHVLEVPHAQRWRDYWNITHDPRDQLDVYVATWRRPVSA